MKVEGRGKTENGRRDGKRCGLMDGWMKSVEEDEVLERNNLGVLASWRDTEQLNSRAEAQRR